MASSVDANMRQNSLQRQIAASHVGNQEEIECYGFEKGILASLGMQLELDDIERRWKSIWVMHILYIIRYSVYDDRFDFLE